MSDFFLDFRTDLEAVATFTETVPRLEFTPETRVTTFERARFRLALSRVDDPKLWAPSVWRDGHGEILVALSGRIAMDAGEWKKTIKLEGEGGLACKAIGAHYRRNGVEALKDLNGNFTVLIYDEKNSSFHIVTDRCGMAVAYETQSGGMPVFASHPDILATATAQSDHLDFTSLAQFVMTGCLSFPHTYYANICAVETGAILSLSFESTPPARSISKYFQHQFSPNTETATDLSAELGEAFKRAVRRRTLPLFGTTGIALSGGLDSRTILSAMEDPSSARTFCLLNEQNFEVRIAERIAASFSLPLELLERDFDYYGRTMIHGTRILGGIASMASNHFLGIRERLVELGIHNLLTGCYCDYIFKALALNTTESGIARVQQQAPFSFEFYRPHFQIQAPAAEAVRSRLQQRFPEFAKPVLSDLDWFNVECKRTFPLAYECDAAQRVIPQRIMPWYLPIVDNEIIDVYQKLPSRRKLNTTFFKTMMKRVCPENLLEIPDSNTGAPVTASRASITIRRYTSALANRLSRSLNPCMATRGSWPNWEYYIQRSAFMRQLWSRPSEAFDHCIGRLFGNNPFPSLDRVQQKDVELFLRLLTLKLWMEQRSVRSEIAPLSGSIKPMYAAI